MKWWKEQTLLVFSFFLSWLFWNFWSLHIWVALGRSGELMISVPWLFFQKLCFFWGENDHKNNPFWGNVQFQLQNNFSVKFISLLSRPSDASGGKVSLNLFSIRSNYFYWRNVHQHWCPNWFFSSEFWVKVLQGQFERGSFLLVPGSTKFMKSTIGQNVVEKVPKFFSFSCWVVQRCKPKVATVKHVTLKILRHFGQITLHILR